MMNTRSVRTHLDGDPAFEAAVAMTSTERLQKMKAANSRLETLKSYERPSAAQQAEMKSLTHQNDALMLAAMVERAERHDGFGDEPGDGNASIGMPIHGARGAAVGPFAKTVLSAGFSLKAKPSVEIDSFRMLKSPTWPSVADWEPVRSPAVVQLGQDTRWLWPLLASETAGTASSIEDFKQTARTLTGTVKRDLNATTDKASLDTTIELVNEPLSQFAVTLDDIPNAVLESVPKFSAFLESEGRFQVEKAIDDHVLAQIVAATPPFGNTGTTLIDKVRNGIAAMKATGANPTIVVLNPTDAASLDLFRVGGSTATDGPYQVDPAGTGMGRLWGLRVVERIGAGNEPPYLIDPLMLGVLYLGQMRFDADPYTGFKKNLTTVRVETKGLFHVRNANGARRIAAT